MSGPVLFIGTATPNGTVAAAHVSSLVAMLQRLVIARIPMVYRTIDGPKLAMQRDILADDFLRSDATHFLLLDGDLQFEPRLAERLLALEAPLAGAAYAQSGPDLREVARLQPELGLDGAIARAAPWTVRPLQGAVRVEADGRARVATLGSGCLLLARECLETLARGLRRYTVHLAEARQVSAFFRDLPEEPQDPVLQDRVCQLWTAAGGEIWIDVGAQVRRLSTFRFGAPFSEYLRATGSAARPADEVRAEARGP